MIPIQPGLPARSPTMPEARIATGPARGNFAAELADARQASGIRFSAHAQQRIDDRRIDLSQADVARIAHSTDLAAAKGSREAVLLMDRLALVVGVPSRTVITVMEPDAGDPAVFTNIDSVVVVPPERT